MEVDLPVGINSPEFWSASGDSPLVFSDAQQDAVAERVRVFLQDLGGFEDALVFATSGSSGQPKWVVHRRETLAASARNVIQHLGLTEKEVFGLCLPTYHVGGMGVICRAALLGAKVSGLSVRWEALAAFQWLSREEVSVLSLVPTQLFDLVQLGRRGPESLRVLVIGGGALDAELKCRALALGYPVFESWGMTEAGSQIATAKVAGGPPYIMDGWKVAHSNPATIEGGGLACGYVRLIDEKPVFESFDGSFETSDAVVLSEGGELLSVQRVDDLVKVLGELVSVDALQRALMQRLPKALSNEWLIMAVKHRRRGHHLWVVVEGEADSDGLAWCEFIGAWNQEVGGLRTIEGVRFLSSFPRSGLSKVQKKKVYEQLFDH